MISEILPGQSKRSGRTNPDEPFVRSTILTFGFSAKTELRPSARLVPTKSPTTSTPFASGALGRTVTSGSTTLLATERLPVAERFDWDCDLAGRSRRTLLGRGA